MDPTENDVLFLGGLGWDVIDCRAVADIRRRTGMKVSCIMYDLIPTKFPNFLGGTPNDYFYNYFLHMVDLCEHVFCISKTTQRDFVEFCSEQKRDAPRNSVMYLGANLPERPSDGEFSSEDRERLSKGRFALSVGTLEIRKNYQLILSIWEELLEDPNFDMNFVIAGMPGWGTDDLVQRLESSPHFGTRIFWFRRLSDAGISWLYDTCDMVLFPSLYEGWGLPVIEALQHGKPVIASNRGSIPEAGLGAAEIIDPDDRRAWLDAIRRYWVKTPTVPPVKLPTWETAADEVKSRLVELH